MGLVPGGGSEGASAGWLRLVFGGLGLGRGALGGLLGRGGLGGTAEQRPSETGQAEMRRSGPTA
jgi:hypothetical protein